MTKFLRLGEVLNRTGLSRSTLYEQISADAFPRPVKISARSNGWPENDIEAWQAARIAERESA